MTLNGWQRLGIIASVIGGLVGFVGLEFEAQIRSYLAGVQQLFRLGILLWRFRLRRL